MHKFSNRVINGLEERAKLPEKDPRRFIKETRESGGRMYTTYRNEAGTVRYQVTSPASKADSSQIEKTIMQGGRTVRSTRYQTALDGKVKLKTVEKSPLDQPLASEGVAVDLSTGKLSGHTFPSDQGTKLVYPKTADEVAAARGLSQGGASTEKAANDAAEAAAKAKGAADGAKPEDPSAD